MQGQALMLILRYVFVMRVLGVRVPPLAVRKLRNERHLRPKKILIFALILRSSRLFERNSATPFRDSLTFIWHLPDLARAFLTLKPDASHDHTLKPDASHDHTLKPDASHDHRRPGIAFRCQSLQIGACCRSMLSKPFVCDTVCDTVACCY